MKPGDQTGVAALRPGIHLCDEEALGREWWTHTSSRWAVGRVSGGDDRRAALRLLGEALGFPDYYGGNMDAAWDCLTDLTEPTVLVWRGWQDLAVHHPQGWAQLLGMFNERCALQPDFAVVLTR